MLTAKNIMTSEVITLTPDTPVNQAAQLLVDKSINAVPVLEAGKLVGIICQSDLIVQQKNLPLPSFFTLLDGIIPLKSTKQLEKEVEKIAAATVGQAMTPDPVVIGPDTPISEVAALMAEKKFHTLPVVEQGEMVGIVGKEDILRTLMP